MGRLYIDQTTLRECALCCEAKPVLRHTDQHRVVPWAQFVCLETTCYYPVTLDIIALGPCDQYAHRFCGRCVRLLLLQKNFTCPYPFTPCLKTWPQHILTHLLTRSEQYTLEYPCTTLTTTTSGVLWCTSTFEYAQVGQQIKHILSDLHGSVKCPTCAHLLTKSIMCNALSHCGWEICFVCGTYERPALSPKHWQHCPRYNHDQYWKTCTPAYQCREDVCYSETQECTLTEHALGKQQMLLARQTFQLQAVWQKLSSYQREHFLPLIKQTPRWVTFL